jgi:hypothetical protein
VVGLVLAISVVACNAAFDAGRDLPDRPENEKAIAPIMVVAQGSGAAGEFRVWAYHTSDGMACIELASTGGASSACDPTGRPPVGGSGVNRNARGVVVWGSTGAALARTAVVIDENGVDLSLPLVDVGPTMPGAKIAIATLGSSANPVAIDFLDAAGSRIDSVKLR